MFDADTGCIATDPAPSARRRFRSKTGIENLPANEHAQETPHTPSPTRTTRRIQSGCAGSRPRLRDGMPGSPSQHIDITRAKWIPYFGKLGIHFALVIVKFTFVSNAIRVGRNKAVHRCFLVCFQHATRPDGRAKWIPYFGKMIAQGGHVTPSIESNPMTVCTRIGILRFLEAAEGSEKSHVYSKLLSIKQPRYKVGMHKGYVEAEA